MKKLLLFSLLLLAACGRKDRDCPAPRPDFTATTFRVFDASAGGQFNTKLTAMVFYFPATYTDPQVMKWFKFDDQVGGWDFMPKVPDEVWHIENEVSPDGFDAAPGSFSRNLGVGQKAMITWTFDDSPQDAPQRYRHGFTYLGLLDGEPQAVKIKVDQSRAGL